MTEQPVYESENITMCTDGKYRWVYELNLYKNPAIIKEVGRVMLISLVIVLVLISGFQIIDGIGTLAERLLFVAELAGILIVILVVGVEFYSNAFGMIEQEIPKTLNVKIPAGVGNGQRIRLKGQGTPGENGGPNGDLWLVIHIAPHPLFDIVGQDLEIVVPVSPWEAALGTKVTVPTLKESILLTIPPGSQAGQRLRVKGKGLVSKKQTGDLYAVLKIVMPPKPDENTAALWQQLADAQSSFDPRKDWGKA